MSKHDWYRNAEWNPEIETRFMAKLNRARHKSQYLRIQASYLAESDPIVALRLLERYFELGDDYDLASAYGIKATAYIALGMIEQAVGAYEAALNRESDFPKYLTDAYLNLPHLIIVKSIESKYSDAITLLDNMRHRLMFPVDHYKWNAAMAVLTARSRSASEAQPYARAALEATKTEKSGFRFHPNIGLFSERKTDQTLYDAVKRIALNNA